MKKLVIYMGLAIIIGVMYGKVIFKQYQQNLEKVFTETSNIYLFQVGAFSSLESVEANVSKFDYYVMEKDDEYYRVYVGVTQDEKNLAKIKEMFAANGNNIYVREVTNQNEAFLTILKQYDLLLEAATTPAQINQIEKQVLAKYEELVINHE